MTNIGNSIHTLRKQHSMTQDDLADLLHVTRQTVSNYENGKSEPDIDTLLRIAEIFHTDVNTLLDSTEHPTAPAPRGSWRTVAILIGCTIAAFVVLDRLSAQATDYASKYYIFHFSWMVAGFWYPCCLFLLGGTVIYTFRQFIRFPQPKPWYRPVRIFLLLFAAVNILPYLPVAFWAAGELFRIAAESPLAAVVPQSVPLWQSHLLLIANHPKLYYTVCTLIGAGLALTATKTPEAV